jgi:hypothetical protein
VNFQLEDMDMDPDKLLLVLLSSELYFVLWVDQLELRLLGQRKLLALGQLNLLLDMDGIAFRSDSDASLYAYLSAGT